jgi:hypothetical protein
MSDRIFNIFVYFEGNEAREYGIRHYRRDGKDDKNIAFLQSLVDTDHSIAKRFELSRAFTAGEWLAMQRRGLDIGFFEDGFRHFRAVLNPLICITSIVNGVPRIDIKSDVSPFWGNRVGKELPGDMQDWLIKYTKGDTFKFDQLINDDYFASIRLLFNARHIASASKLLMSAIDTMAYVEHGDDRGNFAQWLESYVDLASIGLTAAELWEFRNSIIHMTNLSSRAVLAGKVSPILPYIGSDELAQHARSTTMKPFNLYGLIVAVSNGIGKWAESYNTDRDKFLKFIERYDTVISDSRLAEIIVKPGETV